MRKRGCAVGDGRGPLQGLGGVSHALSDGVTKFRKPLLDHCVLGKNVMGAILGRDKTLVWSTYCGIQLRGGRTR